jgi:streptomycin 6-kinase
MFDDYLKRWELLPDGEPIVTHCSRLLPVRQHGVPAMLKVALEAEEKLGWVLMTWWDGHGAARVLAHDTDALLIERATGTTSLSRLARNGHDDEASRIICSVVAKLHAPGKMPPAELIPLGQWFADLTLAADKHGGIIVRCAATARELLASPEDVVALHGDIHHENILDFGKRGWLAIDPKRLIGERGFDYANVFCNPDHRTATAPGRLARQVDVIAEAASLDRTRLLKWILAWAGLSAVWFINDGMPAHTDIDVANLAAAELGG